MNTAKCFGFWVLCAVMLAACGDGLLRLVEIRGSGFTAGSAQGFGSVVVGSVRYDTTEAVIQVDGATVTEAELMVGDQLLVRGTDRGDGTGVATVVSLESDLIATIDAADADAGTVQALEQTIHLDGLTVIDGDPAALLAGQGIRVSGERGPDGALRAGSLRLLATPPATVQLRGQVSSVDAAAQTLRMGQLTVDYAAANVDDGVLRAGARVRVRGVETASGVQADLITAALRGQGAAGDLVRLRGLVLAQADALLTVSGQSVRIGPGATVRGGNPDEVQVGTDLAVIGRLDAAGVVDAAVVDLIRPEERRLPVRIVAQVQAADAGLINALGLEIRPRARTLVRDARDGMRPFSEADLQAGDWVLLRCFGDNGTIVVNRVERIPAADAVEVTAPVIGIDQASNQINVDGVPTNVSMAQFRNAQGQTMSRSQFFAQLRTLDFVSVTGEFDGAALQAATVVLED